MAVARSPGAACRGARPAKLARVRRTALAALALLLPALVTAQGVPPVGGEAAPATIPGPAAALVGLRLVDQFGREGALADHAGRVVVVLVVTARRLGLLEDWEVGLRERIDGLAYLRIADLPESPPPDPARVAERLRLVVPDEVAVLIDPAREWARALSLDTAEPNVLLFDGAGRLAARYRGRWHSGMAAIVAERVAQIEAGG